DLDADGRRDGVFQQTLGSFCGSPQAFVFCGTEGTSMASAHVAGAAAVLRSFRPGATAPQVRQALEQSAQDLGQPGHDPVFGSGALRIHNALLRLDALLLEQAPPGPCQPGPTTLCIDDQPGDGRFRIEVAFATSQAGGITGAGKAIPLAGLGVADGGLFWFFAPENPEMLVKVLDGCGVNGKYWVFYSAGTNVGFVVTVDDTATGRRRTYSNQDLVAAPPVQDTSAFPCS
ncbi:MAG: S8 family serine peptidase, partial [Thermoanaerobaculia bacterium]